MININAKVILVKFPLYADKASKNENDYQDKTYAYYIPNGLEIKKNDLVVVKVTEVFKIVLVSEVEGLAMSDLNKASKFIISKIDTELYEKEMKKVRKVKEIENQLDTRLKQYERFRIFKQMAAEDSEIKKLLEELNTIAPELSLPQSTI